MNIFANSPSVSTTTTAASEDKTHLTDCHFFFNAQCTKGDDCPFRHCESARYNPRVCKFWLQGQCNFPSCHFRHPFIKPKVDPSSTPCYFYSIGACMKGDACEFLHVQPTPTPTPTTNNSCSSTGMNPFTAAANTVNAAATSSDATARTNRGTATVNRFESLTAPPKPKTTTMVSAFAHIQPNEQQQEQQKNNKDKDKDNNKNVIKNNQQQPRQQKQQQQQQKQQKQQQKKTRSSSTVAQETSGGGAGAGGTEPIIATSSSSTTTSTTTANINRTRAMELKERIQRSKALRQSASSSSEEKKQASSTTTETTTETSTTTTATTESPKDEAASKAKRRKIKRPDSILEGVSSLSAASPAEIDRTLGAQQAQQQAQQPQQHAQEVKDTKEKQQVQALEKKKMETPLSPPQSATPKKPTPAQAKPVNHEPKASPPSVIVTQDKPKPQSSSLLSVKRPRTETKEETKEPPSKIAKEEVKPSTAAPTPRRKTLEEELAELDRLLEM